MTESLFKNLMRLASRPLCNRSPTGALPISKISPPMTCPKADTARRR
jgi:hypothetical protein